MEELGCWPDLATYNTILDTCYRNGDLILARSVISKMEMEGVKLYLHAYKCMIKGCCSTNQIDDSGWLFRKMVDKFSASQYSAFDQILCIPCQKGLFDQALELLQQMVVCKNMTPGRRAWEALVQMHIWPCWYTTWEPISEFLHRPYKKKMKIFLLLLLPIQFLDYCTACKGKISLVNRIIDAVV